MKLKAAALAALTVALAATPAAACGGLFCQNIPVDQAGEKILFASDGQKVTAYVQVQYTGDAKDFSWIVPVPSKPELAVGTDQLFQAARLATKPVFKLDLKDEGECKPEPPYPMPMAAAAGGGRVEEGGVAVLSQAAVGPYDTAVIQATSSDSGPLKKWLTDNNYVIPAKVEPMLDPYVAGKYLFVALKLQKDKSAGDLQPIVLTYAADRPGIPIRLTGVAATKNMGVWVWVLGKERAIPENYRHAQINEARIDWLRGGTNYPDVVTEAMNEAQGQAFVTDFAGDSKAVLDQKETVYREQGPEEIGLLDPKKFDLQKLAKLTEPVAFSQAIVADGYFGQRNTTLDAAALVAFLKRHVAKPKAVQEEDTQFYRNVQSHAAAFKAEQITVDTAKAIADLQKIVLDPLDDLQKLFKQFPYLTALYTTMSPEEMTQDPMFRFNGQLPKVSNVHEAKGVRKCDKDHYAYELPVEITLSNGIKFLAAPTNQPNYGGMFGPFGGFGGFGGGALFPGPSVDVQPVPLASGSKPVVMPAALSVDGAGRTVAVPVAKGPSVKADGAGGAGSGAAKGSTPSAGFGCAGCSAGTAAPTAGAGEGLTFALAMAGFLGFRWTRRRKR